MKTFWAIVKFQFEGIHHYKDAVGKEEYLKHDHRHIFHCDVWVEQHHNDRDVEYIKLKRKLQETFYGGGLDNMSCEMIAESILLWLKTNYINRQYKVSVKEDNENGCLIED